MSGVQPYEVTADGSDFDQLWTEGIAKAAGRIANLGLYPVITATHVFFKVDTTYYRRNGLTGIVDDSNADASTLINAAVADNVLLHLSAQTFDLTAPIADNGFDTFILEGEGRGTVLNTTTNIRAIEMIGTGGTYTEDVTIRDLTVHGSGAANAANIGIYMAYGRRNQVQRCYLTNCGGIAAFDAAYLEYSGIDDNWVFDNIFNGIGIAEGSYYDSISRNKVYNHPLNAIDLNGVAAPCEHNWVNDNTLLHTLVGVDLDTADDNTIEDNVCVSNQLGVALEGAGGSDNNLIKGNQITECHGGGGFEAHGIQVGTGCDDNDCIGNKIWSNADGAAILLSGDGGLISGNPCHLNNEGLNIYGDNYQVTSNAFNASPGGNGLLIEAGATANRIMSDNQLSDNGGECISDSGTGTVLTAIPFHFIKELNGTYETASPTGVLVDAGTEAAILQGFIPQSIQQVVRLRLGAVAKGAPINAGGQMHLELTFNAGAPNAAYNTAAKSWSLVNFDGEEADYVNGDVVTWLIEDGDVGNELINLASLDGFELLAIYETGADPDGATNAVFRTLNLEIV